jgi:DNA-binding GntR family transcriptional regulator
MLCSLQQPGKVPTIGFVQTAASVAPASLRPSEDRLYAAVYAAIQDHRLVPGTKLKETSLAELFGVSRAVVRKALERLAHMHLVELRPNRVALVATPSAEESRQIFHARRTIETAIAALAAERAAPRDIALLRQGIAAERDAYEAGDVRGGLEHAIAFHRRLASIAGNAVLARFLEELISRMPLVLLTHGGAGASACASDEHTPVVEAILAHDAPRAARLMDEHLRHLEREALHERPAPPADLAAVFATAPA